MVNDILKEEKEEEKKGHNFAQNRSATPSG